MESIIASMVVVGSQLGFLWRTPALHRDQALDEIAEQLQRIVDHDGADAVGAFRGTRRCGA